MCVSEPAAADLRRRGIATPRLVPNGWDPESAPQSVAPTGLLDPYRRSIVYTGRFGSYGRDPRALVAALAAARPVRSRRGGEARARDRRTADEPTRRRCSTTDVAPARIVRAGSLERERALALQREADALLLVAQPTRSQLLNIKLFEYLASGAPILALAAGTEAGRVAGELGAEVVAADDQAAITAALARVAAGELAAPAPRRGRRRTPTRRRPRGWRRRSRPRSAAGAGDDRARGERRGRRHLLEVEGGSTASSSSTVGLPAASRIMSTRAYSGR